MLKIFVEIKFEICSIYKALRGWKWSIKIYRTISRGQGYKRHTEIRGRIRKQFRKMLITSSSLRSSLKCFSSTSFSSFKNLF